VARAGDTETCTTGRHVVYAPDGTARVRIEGAAYELATDHALRIRADATTAVRVEVGTLLIASITAKA